MCWLEKFNKRSLCNTSTTELDHVLRWAVQRGMSLSCLKSEFVSINHPSARKLEDVAVQPNYCGPLDDLAYAVLIYSIWRVGQESKRRLMYSRRVLSLRPFGHPSLLISLNNLANTLIRWEQSGRIQEAIVYSHSPLSCPPNRSISLNNLAGVVLICYEQRGRIEYYREALTQSHSVLLAT